MSEYQEFTGKNVEEALRNAREAFGVTGLDDLDFEILTAGSRGVLGMGAEPARIVAAPRAALGGAAPRREAAASVPLPAPSRPEREPDGRDRDAGRGFSRDRGRSFERSERPDRRDRPERPDRPDRVERPSRQEPQAPRATSPGGPPSEAPGGERPEPRQRRDGGRRPDAEPGPRREGAREVQPAGDRAPETSVLSDADQQQLASRGPLSVEREEIQAAEASPEALAAGKEILEQLLAMMDLDVAVTIRSGETSKLDVEGREENGSLGVLIGRKGERLSALQHLLNLMLSRRMGSWTRVLVDVEDYRGRRERQLRDLALRASERVVETGKMLQLEPMPALERRWVHLTLRGNPQVMTQSIGEEPNRRVVVLRRET
jgi:spoIIIJ-associated protein